jgi:hypothetical protein
MHLEFLNVCYVISTKSIAMQCQPAGLDIMKFNSLNAELNSICHLLVLLGNLTFMGPCIVNIFQYISNKMQNYTVYLYLNTVVCAPDDGWKYHPKHVEQFPDINKLCDVASFWIYSYIGILLGAHPILHISRIRVNVLNSLNIHFTIRGMIFACKVRSD